jgi:UDP-N-acetylglucosamine pyrophosphorylase
LKIIKSFNNQHRTLIEQHNFEGSITEKLQFHQQQRLLKRLYKYPLKNFFGSHLLKQDDNERLPPNSNSPGRSKKPARNNFSISIIHILF